MLTISFSIFFILHSLVHLLYAGQSGRLFELRPHLTWPDGSWAFSPLLNAETLRPLAGIALTLAALGFVASGVGATLQQGWWRPLIIGSSIFSSLLWVMLWDGKWRALDEQGGVGLLINLALLAAVLILRGRL